MRPGCCCCVGSQFVQWVPTIQLLATCYYSIQLFASTIATTTYNLLLREPIHTAVCRDYCYYIQLATTGTNTLLPLLFAITYHQLLATCYIQPTDRCLLSFITNCFKSLLQVTLNQVLLITNCLLLATYHLLTRVYYSCRPFRDGYARRIPNFE